jgi:small GTP-binding protein
MKPSLNNSYIADIKLIIVGNSYSGKTSIVRRWTLGQFEDIYQATIISDFNYKIMNINGELCRVQIWDIAGQDRNSFITNLFCKDSQGVLIVCEINNEQSLTDTILWKETILEKMTDEQRDIPFLLVQNKKDLLSENEYNESLIKLKRFKDKNAFYDCGIVSAKNGEGINEVMDKLLDGVVKRMKMLGVNKRMDGCKNDNVTLKKKIIENEYNVKESKCC